MALGIPCSGVGRRRFIAIHVVPCCDAPARCHTSLRADPLVALRVASPGLVAGQYQARPLRRRGGRSSAVTDGDIATVLLRRRPRYRRNVTPSSPAMISPQYHTAPGPAASSQCMRPPEVGLNPAHRRRFDSKIRRLQLRSTNHSVAGSVSSRSLCVRAAHRVGPNTPAPCARRPVVDVVPALHRRLLLRLLGDVDTVSQALPGDGSAQVTSSSGRALAARQAPTCRLWASNETPGCADELAVAAAIALHRPRPMVDTRIRYLPAQCCTRHWYKDVPVVVLWWALPTMRAALPAI